MQRSSPEVRRRGGADDAHDPAAGAKHDGVSVVRIIARLNVGGPAIHVLNLCRGQEAVYPTLLVTGQVDSTEVDIRETRDHEGVRIANMGELGRTISPWQDLRAFAKLYRLLRKVRPAIVHTHTAKAGTLGRLAAVAARVPVRVHTFHGHVLDGYFSPLKSRLAVLIERLLAVVTTRLVTVSDLQARDLVNKFAICDADRMTVIPLGFDLSPFDADVVQSLRGQFREELGIAERAVIVTVGRLVPIKNHRLLLEAARELRRSGVTFALVIVGGGPEESALRQIARDLGVADVVEFVGWRHDINRIYADADVVALSSINEGTPVCLIEALAAGCAVVSTDVGGVRDVLENGRLGTIVPSADPRALADGIRALLEDVTARRRLGELGSVSVRQRFGVERLVNEMNNLYDELLPKQKSTAKAPHPAQQ